MYCKMLFQCQFLHSTLDRIIHIVTNRMKLQATTIAALVSTTAISLAPNILLFLFPTYRPQLSSGLNPLSIGQALAAGGLLGDVFLHTLPHEIRNDNGELIGVAVLFGFVVFFMFDVFVRFYGTNSGHAHKNTKYEKTKNKTTSTTKQWSSAAVLNFAADSLHNFTDGIAIGASFAGSSFDLDAPLMDQVMGLLRSKGGMASLAVLFHEIPHELGDFSILVSSGFTKIQAIQTQFITALAAYCGTFVGLYGMVALKDVMGSDLMTPFTAGGFLYLACVTILPELLHENVSPRARMAQILAFCVGIGFMYFVSVLEHDGHVHDHQSHDNHHHHREHIHHVDHRSDGRHIHLVEQGHDSTDHFHDHHHDVKEDHYHADL